MSMTDGKALRKHVATAILYLCLVTTGLSYSNDNSAVAGALQGKNTPESGKLLSANGNELHDLLVRFDRDHQALGRTYTTPMSETRQERLEQFYKAWLNRTKAIEFKSLSQDAKVDYLLFENLLSYRLRRLAITAKDNAEVAPIVPFAEGIISIQESRQRMEPIDPAAAASKLDTIREEVEAVRKVLEEKLDAEEDSDDLPFERSVSNRALARIGNLKNSLNNWYEYYHGYDPLFTWWAEEPYTNLNKTLESYTEFVRDRLVGIEEDDNTTIIGDPIGREALLLELKNEMIPYTPEELIAIANKEFAWCDAEMLRASNELGYGDDWHAALEHVKTLHVEPGEQPDLIRDLVLESTDFVEVRDLVTVPDLAKEIWRIEMMSPERQLVNPFFTGGETISVSYPTNTMTHEQKLMSMRGNNRHFSRATVHHEIVPGHHLQLFMADRHRTYRKLFRTPFAVEGWALYWEMLLWDLDFQQSPEDRIGMLFWRMHRSARIIFSLSFHLDKMTPQECIDFLVERVGHERENAEGEVRRSFAGNYSPLYQCAYLLGGLQIRALHRDLVASGEMSNKDFHDSILQLNSIPIEMVRATLTEQDLSRRFTTKWKFYGDNPGADQ